MLAGFRPRDPANAKAFFGREIAYLQSKGLLRQPGRYSNDPSRRTLMTSPTAPRVHRCAHSTT